MQFRQAREELVRLLRKDYVWPGVSCDAEGLQQLEQQELSVHLQPTCNWKGYVLKQVRMGYALHRVGRTDYSCAPGTATGAACIYPS